VTPKRFRHETWRWVALVERVVLAAVFVWAAVPKLLDPAAFAEAIANYHLVPDALVGAVAVVVPVLELVIAVALVVGLGARGAAIAAAAMLVSFTIGMIQAMARGIDLDCGCFGTATKTEVGWGSIARNVALIGLAVVIAILPDAKWRKKPPPAGTSPKAPAAAAAAAMLLLALAPGCSACGDSAPEPQVTPIAPLGLSMHLAPGARITAGDDRATIMLEPETRTPRTIELRKIEASVARRWPEQTPHLEGPIADGLATVSYNVVEEPGGSGGNEMRLTGVFELCGSGFQVICVAQGEPPPDPAWCLALLDTLRCPAAPAP
jgi:uncharacterized membrane protein YphA (DoxX/SURF4 family)